MIVSPLLEKTRLINKILQKCPGRYVEFKEIAKTLQEVIQANVYIIDGEGAVLGYALVVGFECEIMVNQVLEGNLPERYNEFLLKSDELRYNLKPKSHSCVFTGDLACLFAGRFVTVIPMIEDGIRLGTLLLARMNELFIEDLILAERGAAVVGMQILRKKLEKIAEETRSKAVVKLAVDALSYTEAEAAEQLFKEISGVEGLLVTGKIANELGISRSVIVNALRKLESAGVLESHSLGMKGTYIRVLNPYCFQYMGSKI